MEIPVTKANYHYSILKMLDPFFHLTNTERKIVSLMLRDGEHRLTSVVRDRIKKETGLSTFNINNYVIRLQNKKVLKKVGEDNKFTLAQGIVNSCKEGKVEVKFIITE